MRQEVRGCDVTRISLLRQPRNRVGQKSNLLKFHTRTLIPGSTFLLERARTLTALRSMTAPRAVHGHTCEEYSLVKVQALGEGSAILYYFDNIFAYWSA